MEHEQVLSTKEQVNRALCWRLRDQLLDSTPEWLEVEGEGTRLGMQKPLLLELQERIQPSGEVGTGGGGSVGPGLPVAANALDLMQDIEREMADQMWLLPRPESRPEKLAEKIRYWVDCLNIKPELIGECHAVLSRWVQQIQELFDPPVVVQLRRPCPACHSTHALIERDGEKVQTRALTAVIRQERMAAVVIECRECGAKWTGSNIFELEEMTREPEG